MHRKRYSRLVTHALRLHLRCCLLELINFFLRQVDELQVVGNSLGCDTLGKRVGATAHLPADEDVGTLDVVLLGQLVNSVERGMRGTRRAQRAVGLGQDVVLLEPGQQLGLRVTKRELDLVFFGV